MKLSSKTVPQVTTTPPTIFVSSILARRQLAVDCADVILEDDAFYLIKGYNTESKDTGEAKFVFMSDSYRVRAHRYCGIEEAIMNNKEFLWKVVNLHTNQHGLSQFLLYNPYRNRYMVKVTM